MAKRPLQRGARLRRLFYPCFFLSVSAIIFSIVLNDLRCDRIDKIGNKPDHKTVAFIVS